MVLDSSLLSLTAFRPRRGASAPFLPRWPGPEPPRSPAAPRPAVAAGYAMLLMSEPLQVVADVAAVAGVLPSGWMSTARQPMRWRPLARTAAEAHQQVCFVLFLP